MTWLRIAGSRPMGFHQRNSAVPGDFPDLRYDRLQQVSELRRPLGPGTEAANMSITLDNGDGALTALMADPPLRLPAAIGQGDQTLFTGVITQLRGGAELSLSLEG